MQTNIYYQIKLLNYKLNIPIKLIVFTNKNWFVLIFFKLSFKSFATMIIFNH